MAKKTAAKRKLADVDAESQDSSQRANYEEDAVDAEMAADIDSMDVDLIAPATDIVDAAGGPSSSTAKSKGDSKKKCKCGGTDHQRVTSQLCPLYKKKSKYDAGLDENGGPTNVTERTTKIGLNSILRPNQQDVRIVIEDMVARITQVTVEACILANLWVIHMCENNVPIPSINYNNFAYQLFKGLTAGPNSLATPKNPAGMSVEMLHVRDNIYAPLRQNAGIHHWVNNAYIAPMLYQAANEWAVNAKNHIVINIGGRVYWYIWYKLYRRGMGQYLTPAEIKTLAFHMCRATRNPNFVLGNPAFTYSSAVNNLAPVHVQAAQNICDGVYGKIRQVFPINLDEDSVGAQWWLLLPGLHRVLRAFHRFRQRIQVANVPQPRGKSIRLFNLLPVAKLRRHYIHITNTGIQAIHAAAGYTGLLPGPPINALNVSGNEQLLWESAFFINRASSGYGGNRRFAGSISTDGVGTSVHIMRPWHAQQGTDAYGFDQLGHYIPIGEFDPTDPDRTCLSDYNGIDPGRKDVVTMVHGDEKGESRSYSLKHYRSLCGFDRATVKRSKMIRAQGQQFTDWLAGMFHV
jgi:hypothetical protein